MDNSQALKVSTNVSPQRRQGGKSLLGNTEVILKDHRSEQRVDVTTLNGMWHHVIYHYLQRFNVGTIEPSHPFSSNHTVVKYIYSLPHIYLSYALLQ